MMTTSSWAAHLSPGVDSLAARVQELLGSVLCKLGNAGQELGSHR